jgi:SHOCT-like protein
MDNDRKLVLQMLADSKITVEEAERLLAALDRDAPPAAGSASGTAKPLPKYLRVMVESADHHGDGPGRVNLRVPMQLLRAGVRLASLMPPAALERVNEALRAQSLPIDLTKLKPQDVEALVEQLHDVTIDVSQPDVKVRVFAE